MQKYSISYIMLGSLLILSTFGGSALVNSSFSQQSNGNIPKFEYISKKPYSTIKINDIIADLKKSAQPKVVQAAPLPAPVEQEIQVNSYQLQLVSKLLMEEAGNQPTNGKIAVLNVLQNRLDNGWAPTIEGVIFAPKQFSSVKKAVRANAALASRSNAFENFYDERRQPNDECVELAKLMLQGKLERVLPEGVVYFYNPQTATDPWIKTRKVYEVIGDHAFAYESRK